MSRSLREDIHIHAQVDAVRARLVPAAVGLAYGWLPEAFADARWDDGALSFRLALPLCSERAQLHLGSDDGRALEFVAASGSDAIRAMTWVMNPEGVHEVHLLAELAYDPVGGPFGWLLEMALHRPLRQQALRDALWRLKLIVEGRS